MSLKKFSFIVNMNLDVIWPGSHFKWDMNHLLLWWDIILKWNLKPREWNVILFFAAVQGIFRF